MKHIETVTIHHTNTSPDWMECNTIEEKVSEIKRWHEDKFGWSGMGYHTLIDRDGKVAIGRNVAWESEFNPNGIDIALIGGQGSDENDNFADYFTAEQNIKLRFLIQSLHEEYGITKIVNFNETPAKVYAAFNVENWFNFKETVRKKPLYLKVGIALLLLGVALIAIGLK